MDTLLQLFWLFIKVNLLSTSGPASVGLLYKETVGVMMTEAQFIEAVGFSYILPGSEALKLAMFIGFAVNGVGGALVALAGSILPPTLLMLGVVVILHRLQREAWVNRFVNGLSPAIAVLMLFVAGKMLVSNHESMLNWQTILIGAASLVALLFDAPAPLVLLGAGLLGIFIF